MGWGGRFGNSCNALVKWRIQDGWRVGAHFLLLLLPLLFFFSLLSSFFFFSSMAQNGSLALTQDPPLTDGKCYFEIGMLNLAAKISCSPSHK
jgi:hypothetical protein